VLSCIASIAHCTAVTDRKKTMADAVVDDVPMEDAAAAVSQSWHPDWRVDGRKRQPNIAFLVVGS
jgi:hypothetical protein